MPTATKHRLLVSTYIYTHIYIPDRAPLYLPVTSMTILTRVSTLRRTYPSSLTRFEPKSRAPSRSLGSSSSYVNRAKLVQRSGRTLRRIVLARAAIYCVFEIMQSSGCRLPPRWLLCTSIPLLSLFLFLSPPPLVYIKYNIVARFRRYRLAGSRQSTIKPRRI